MIPSDKILMSKLGKYLQKKRKLAKLSQGKVSKLLGYSSPQMISNIERGTCAPPMDALKKMAALYKISASEMTETLLQVQKDYFKSEFSKVESSHAALRAKAHAS